MVMVGGVCSSLDWSSLVLSFLSPCEQCCCGCDACDKAAPSPCASGCGELPSLPSASRPALPHPSRLALSSRGRLLNPRKRRVFGRGRALFGGEQLWECFSCGHNFTGGRITAFLHCSPPLDLQLVPLTAPKEGWCRCVSAAVLLEIIPSL